MSMTVVPTRRTRAIASALIREAVESTGADAVLNHVDHLDATGDQMYALIAVLLTQAKIHRKAGRPPLPLRFTEEQRREANTAYKHGSRDPEVIEGWREYQRVSKRNGRDRPVPFPTRQDVAS